MFGTFRLYYMFTMDFTDVTALQLPVIIMGTVEPGVIIMVSSSPLLKPIFDTIFRHVLSWLSFTAGSKEHSQTSPGGDTTLLTFGGGNVKAKHVTPVRSRKKPENRDTTSDDHGIYDLELGGWRDHEHEVAVTA